MNSDATEDLFHISQLIDQLRHDDNALRVNAAKNVVKIARALGAERTRNELVPFIGESIDDEDDVVLVYAEKLGELVSYVGGNQYACKILEALELLCSAEENAVREMTMKSIGKVVAVMPEEHIEAYLAPLILRLAGKEWYTSRASAACLMHIAYPKMKENRRQTLKDLFVRLCTDDTPTVRKVGAANFGPFCREITQVEGRIPAEFIRTFSTLASDDQDSVRISNIQNCIALCEVLSVEAKMSQILPVIVRLADDKAWRVRWCLTHKLHEIGKVALQLPTSASMMASAAGGTSGGNGSAVVTSVAVEPENYTNLQISIVNSLEVIAENLLNDSEAEVRSAAAANIHQFSRLFRKNRVVSMIIPCIEKLADDNASEYVRTSVALSINELSTIVGKDATVEYLLPLLLKLLRDPASPVRLNIIANLHVLNKVVGVESLSQSLLPAIIDLSNDTKWRVRLAIIELMPMLVKQLGLQFFTEDLCDLTLSWLCDKVYTIRRAASENLRALTTEFGEAWSIKNIIPKVQTLAGQTNYLQRIISLYALQTISASGTFSNARIIDTLYPMAAELAKDSVPNIRFAAVKALAAMHSQLKKGATTSAQRAAAGVVTDKIEATLCEMRVDDTDKDVNFFTTQALKEIEAANQ